MFSIFSNTFLLYQEWFYSIQKKKSVLVPKLVVFFLFCDGNEKQKLCFVKVNEEKCKKFFVFILFSSSTSCNSINLVRVGNFKRPTKNELLNPIGL